MSTNYIFANVFTTTKWVRRKINTSVCYPLGNDERPWKMSEYTYCGWIEQFYFVLLKTGRVKWHTINSTIPADLIINRPDMTGSMATTATTFITLIYEGTNYFHSESKSSSGGSSNMDVILRAGKKDWWHCTRMWNNTTAGSRPPSHASLHLPPSRTPTRTGSAQAAALPHSSQYDREPPPPPRGAGDVWTQLTKYDPSLTGQKHADRLWRRFRGKDKEVANQKRKITKHTSKHKGVILNNVAACVLMNPTTCPAIKKCGFLPKKITFHQWYNKTHMVLLQ